MYGRTKSLLKHEADALLGNGRLRLFRSLLTGGRGRSELLDANCALVHEAAEAERVPVSQIVRLLNK